MHVVHKLDHQFPAADISVKYVPERLHAGQRLLRLIVCRYDGDVAASSLSISFTPSTILFQPNR